MSPNRSPRKTRASKHLLRLFSLMVGAAPLANAAEIVKADNLNDLTTAGSWVGGTVPGANDVAVFDSTLTAGSLGAAPYYFPVGAALPLKGIKVVNAIDGIVFDTFLSGGTAINVTLGTSGLDASLANPGTTFKFDSPTITLAPGAAQTWSVADGATVTALGPITTNGAQWDFNLGTLGTGIFQLDGLSATANAIIHRSSISTPAGLNFAAKNASSQIVSAETVVPVINNPAETTPGTAVNLAAFAATGGYLDVTVSNQAAAARAFNIAANLFPSNTGLRFARPHKAADGVTDSGLPWTVSFGGNGRIQPSLPFSILVTPGVGATNVEFGNGTGAHEFRFNNSGSNFGQLIIEQYNTAGNLIWRGDSTANSVNVNNTFTKTGPGKVIWAAPTYGPTTAPVFITQGTLQLGEGGTAGTLNNVAITNNGTFRVNRSGTVALSNLISGTGSVEVAMATGGVLQLTGANTFSGVTKLESGTLQVTSATTLGANGGVNFAGGTLAYGAGFATDVSGANTSVTANSTIDTGSNAVTYANAFGNSGTGGLTKTGSGSLTLAGANTYSGNTTVSAGTLNVTNTSGSGTGSGNVSVAAGATLGGSGTISGAVSTVTGSKIAPGVGGVGTLTVGSLTLANASLLDLEFAGGTTHDKIVVTGSNGLTVNGGGLSLYQPASALAYSTPGTYNVFQYSGTLGGSASNLSVLNPTAGFDYTFGTSGSNVTLTIAAGSTLSGWNVNGGGSWGTASNWTPATVPEGTYVAQFNTELTSPATVTLDGVRTVNGLSFNSAQGYTVAAGTSGSLVLSKASGSAAVNVLAGTHTVSAPVSLSSTMATTTEAGSGVTFSGAISGSAGITKAGAGSLSLTGANTFNGDVIGTGGEIVFGQASSLGNGNLSLSGTTLTYGAGNTADISSKVFTVSLNGANVNTNGNNVTFANAIGNSGSGVFTKSGNGTLTLAAGNTYTGGTVAAGGTLVIADNSSLGSPALASTLTFNGGYVSPAASMTLDNAGANARPISVGAGSGGFDIGAGIVLTANGAISGTGALVKNGAGELFIPSNNATYTGGAVINAGTVRLALNDTAIGQSGLGSGPITLGNGASLYANGAGITMGATSHGVLSNAVTVPTGATASLYLPGRGGFSGVLSGDGTLNIAVDATRCEIPAAWPAFTGTVNFIPTDAGLDDVWMTAAQNVPLGKVHLAAGVQTNQSFNPPNSGALTTTHTYGELTAEVGSVLGGNTVAGRFNEYAVGGLNTNFSIDGQLRGSLNIFGYGYPRLTKNGTGTLTLTNSHMTTGSITVNAGELKLLGNIERHYTLVGVDAVFGRHPTSLVCDDTIQLTEPTTGVLGTDYVYTEPGAFTVAAGATLSGNGKLGGVVTINGNLRPDATGTLGGQLMITGSGSLNLAATATTQFDFDGVSYTGIKSTATNSATVTVANTFGGAVKLNFLGTVYNGNYSLFDLTVPATGAFTSVSVTTLADGEVPLTDSGGVWVGTYSGVSYSFSTTTGVLSITGGSTAVSPGTPVVTATGADSLVTLSWAAVSGADTYSVKRATVSGGPYTTLAAAQTTTGYADTAVTNNVTYYYVVQGRNNSGLLGGVSAEVSATPNLVLPGAPTGLTATGGNNTVALSWTSGANTTTFNVLRSATAGGPFYTTIATGVATSSYNDNTAVNGTTYYYVVQGVNGSGAGSYSNEANATPVSPLTALQSWRVTYFGSEANTGNGADDADADGDGISNLIEYATGTIPTNALSKAAPIPGVSGNAPTLTFNRIADPNLTYTVRPNTEVTTAWSLTPVFTSTGVSNTAGAITVTDPTAVSAGGRRFLRLEVTY